MLGNDSRDGKSVKKIQIFDSMKKKLWEIAVKTIANAIVRVNDSVIVGYRDYTRSDITLAYKSHHILHSYENIQSAPDIYFYPIHPQCFNLLFIITLILYLFLWINISFVNALFSELIIFISLY